MDTQQTELRKALERLRGMYNLPTVSPFRFDPGKFSVGTMKEKLKLTAEQIFYFIETK